MVLVVILYASSALASTALAIAALSHRAAWHTRASLVIAMLSLAGWSALWAFQVWYQRDNDAPDAYTSGWVWTLPWAAAAIAGFALLATSLTRPAPRRASPSSYLYTIHPIVMVVVALTPSAREAIIVTGPDGLPALGWGFWIHTAFAYALLTTSLVRVITVRDDVPALQSVRVWALVAAISVPTATNLLSISWTGPTHPDFTSMAFVATSWFAWVAFLRRGLLDVVPVARAHVLGTNGTDLFVFDGSDFSEPEGEPDSTAYGSVRVDFRNYEFSDAFEAAQRERRERVQPRFEPEDHVNEDGSFRERRYKLRFSPDIIYGNVGYDALYGVQSVTQMMFSDVLGNHRILAATNLIIDLRNSDYLLSYEYRPRRTDFALTGFHLARQLTDFSRQTVYRYRNYGLTFSASYPLDKFRRVDGEMSVLGTSLTDLVDPALRARSRVFLYPAVAFTHDGTEPGFLSPAGGRRYAVRLAASPGLSVTFATLLADARQYVGFGRFYSLAFRASGGVSVGPDPQRFYAAGVQNWINPQYDSLPIEDENDFVFGTPVLPLRGYDLDEASGSRFGLLNAEFRAPLVAALLPGPLPIFPLYNIQGTAFLDVGTIYSDDFNLRRTNEEGKEVLDDLFVGAGLGLRTILFGYPLRLDWAWPYDGRGFGDRRLYFSIGLDF